MVKKLTTQETQQFEASLKQLLGSVTGDIQSLEDEAQGDGTDHKVSAEDCGSEVNALELSLELLERDERTVQEIVAALGRVKHGTFGLCERCREPIRKPRLAAMPYARNCIDCQRAKEVGSRGGNA